MDNHVQLGADMFCQIEVFNKSFTLKVAGCSLTKHINFEVGMVIAKFDLGGHSWAVNFSPYTCSNHLILSVSLLTETNTEMGLDIEFSMLDNKTGAYTVRSAANVKSFGPVKKRGDSIRVWNIMSTGIFEANYVKNDCCTLKLVVRVLKPCLETRNKQVLVPEPNFIQSDLYQHSIHLWETGEGADVAFKVSEELITAHRNVLVARSHVFRAQFFSPMIESRTNCIIEVDDMEPEVFKLVLQFIYTDNLPSQKELSPEMAQHLLVAADRYGLERLKLISEEKLSANLSVDTAATTLVLAEQHNCEQLKERCINYVASRENLQAVLATDEFRHLIESCPLILKDLLVKLDCDRSN